MHGKVGLEKMIAGIDLVGPGGRIGAEGSIIDVDGSRIGNDAACSPQYVRNRFAWT